MNGKYFDLVGIIHGREYSDHGQFVTADDYYHLQLYSEAIARLKLDMEQDMEKLQAENESLRKDAARYKWLKERNGGPIGIVAWHQDEEKEMVLVELYADEAIDAVISAKEARP